MKTPENSREADFGALLKSQQGLVEAHLSLIRLQQDRGASVSDSDLHSLKAVNPSVGEHAAAKAWGAPLAEIGTSNNLAEHVEPAALHGLERGAIGSAVQRESDLGSLPMYRQLILDFRKNGFLVAALVFVSVGSVYAVFRAPGGGDQEKRLREEMRALESRYKSELLSQKDALVKTESELVGTQAALRNAQSKISETEKALAESLAVANGANASGFQAPGNPIKVPNTATVEARPITDAERREQVKAKLQDTERAVVDNRVELAKNLKEYYATCKALALARKKTFEAELEVRRRRGDLSEADFQKQLRPWESYLPDGILDLMNSDPRLSFSSVDQGLRNSAEASLGQLTGMLKEATAYLTSIMKEVTDTQASIIRVQGDLSVELARYASLIEVLDGGVSSEIPKTLKPIVAPAGKSKK